MLASPTSNIHPKKRPSIQLTKDPVTRVQPSIQKLPDSQHKTPKLTRSKQPNHFTRFPHQVNNPKPPKHTHKQEHEVIIAIQHHEN